MLVARPRALALAALVWLLAWAAVAAEAPSWDAVAGTDTVEVVSTNPDGTLRYTTVWLAVVGGRGYLRTGDTAWGANVVRHPEIELVIGDQRYALRAELVEGEDERALVVKAFNEKYGWEDTVVGWFYSARPKIIRLAAR